MPRSFPDNAVNDKFRTNVLRLREQWRFDPLVLAFSPKKWRSKRVLFGVDISLIHMWGADKAALAQSRGQGENSTSQTWPGKEGGSQ